MTDYVDIANMDLAQIPRERLEELTHGLFEGMSHIRAAFVEESLLHTTVKTQAQVIEGLNQTVAQLNDALTFAVVGNGEDEDEDDDEMLHKHIEVILQIVNLLTNPKVPDGEKLRGIGLLVTWVTNHPVDVYVKSEHLDEAPESAPEKEEEPASEEPDGQAD